MSETQRHTYSSIEPRTRVLIDDEMMREILRDVGGMRTALELELWASWLLGQGWKQRIRLPLFQEADWMLALGTPMIGMIAGIGGARARKALSALSMLDRGAFGSYAGAVALTLPGARTPAWMADITGARFTCARAATMLGEGEAVLLDLHRGTKHELSVAVFIDHQFGGIAKWIQLLEPVPEDNDEEFWTELDPVELAPVAQRVRAAIEASDRDPRAPVDSGFADLRAFLLARVIDVCGSDAG
jgi:hypothetical protein